MSRNQILRDSDKRLIYLEFIITGLVSIFLIYCYLLYPEYLENGLSLLITVIGISVMLLLRDPITKVFKLKDIKKLVRIVNDVLTKWNEKDEGDEEDDSDD